MSYLRHQDKEYQEVMRKKNVLRVLYPCIDRLMEEPAAMEISSEEHEKDANKFGEIGYIEFVRHCLTNSRKDMYG